MLSAKFVTQFCDFVMQCIHRVGLAVSLTHTLILVLNWTKKAERYSFDAPKGHVLLLYRWLLRYGAALLCAKVNEVLRLKCV